MTYIEEKRIWFILGAVFILCFLLNIEYSAVNLVLVPVSREFNEDLNTLQWLLSGYPLAWAATAIIGGRLSDNYGGRRMFFIGTWLFCLASLICGVSWSTWVIILGRILQGIAGGLFVSPLYSILFLESPEDKKGLTMGLLGISCGIGLAFGPSIGGTLLELLSWRWIFYLNIPLCLISMWIIYILTQKESLPKEKEPLNLKGTFFLSSTIILFLFTLNQSEVWGLTSVPFLACIGTSFLLFIIFLKIQRGSSNQIVPRNLYSNSSYVGCITGISFFEYVFSSTLLIVNLYLQNVLEYTAYESGLIFFSMTLALGGLSPVGGKLCDTMDGRIPICLGMFIASIGCIWFSSFNESTDLTTVILALGVIGIGLGLAFPAFNAVMLKTVDPSVINTASGLFSAGVCVALSAGVIISSSLLTGFGQSFLLKLLPSTLSSEVQARIMNYLASASQDIKTLSDIPNISYLVPLIKEAYTDTLKATMFITSCVSFLGSLLCLLLIKKNRSK